MFIYITEDKKHKLKICCRTHIKQHPSWYVLQHNWSDFVFSRQKIKYISNKIEESIELQKNNEYNACCFSFPDPEKKM